MTQTKVETITERAKETASKIRKALKSSFPGTKFSVRASEYSMGSSVNVSWTDLPTTKQVEEITNQFTSGSFNGMEDIYETSGYMFEGKRVIGAKYITTSRSLSDEYKEVITNYMNEHAPHIAESTYYTGYTKLYKAEEYMLEQQQKEVEAEKVKIDNMSPEEKYLNDIKVSNVEFLQLCETYGLNMSYSVKKFCEENLDSICSGQSEYRAIVKGTFPKELSDIAYNLYEVLEDSKKEIKQPITSKITNNSNDNITVEMTLNNDLNGVELRFSDKPNETVRSELKANKFRYSKPQKLWYAKQTQQTILFAESLVSIYNDVQEEVEQVETVEAIETTEQNENNSLIGRKVFGQWGVMSGWNYGYITKVIEEDAIITWEDWEEGSSERQVYVNDLIVVDEHTSLDPVGIYLLENETVEVVATNEELHITGDTVETEQTRELKEIEPSQNGKYKVKEILFLWSEYSSIIANNTKVNNFLEADTLIKKVAQAMEEDSGYYKTKFVITWENEETYTGRIDIEKEYLFQQSPLKEHIENHCTFYGGTRKPHWMSESDYNNHVNMASKEEQQAYINIS